MLLFRRVNEKRIMKSDTLQETRQTKTILTLQSSLLISRDAYPKCQV